MDGFDAAHHVGFGRDRQLTARPLATGAPESMFTPASALSARLANVGRADAGRVRQLGQIAQLSSVDAVNLGGVACQHAEPLTAAEGADAVLDAPAGAFDAGVMQRLGRACGIAAAENGVSTLLGWLSAEHSHAATSHAVSLSLILRPGRYVDVTA